MWRLSRSYEKHRGQVHRYDPVSDLPYGTTACKWDTIISLEPLWTHYKRIVKDNAAIVLMGSQPFTTTLIASNMKMFKYELIWDKGKGSNPQLAGKMPMKSHENMLIFYKKLPIYNPQMTDGSLYVVPRTGGKRTNRVIDSKDKPGFQQKTKDTSKRFPISIHKYSIHCGSKVHPTQKPVALFEYLIKTYTNEGDLVLDNCTGSGTTGIACINTNRQFILIEKDPDYYEIARKRIAAMPGRLI